MIRRKGSFFSRKGWLSIGWIASLGLTAALLSQPGALAQAIQNIGCLAGVACQAGSLALNAQTNLTAPASGQLQIANNAGSSVVSITANTNTAQFGGGIFVSTNGVFGWPSKSNLMSQSDGIITLFNAAQSGFNRVNLGGTTASFPALKVNGAVLQARLADDSAFANFNANLIAGNSLQTNTNILALKIAQSNTAPGASTLKLEVVAGTLSGSCKLIAYAGTSTTPSTILDNIGGAGAGC